MKKVGFIGTGNMGGSLALAACRAIGSTELVITDRAVEKVQALGKALGCTVEKSPTGVVEHSEYIFLCVKPNGFRTLLEELSPSLKACQVQGERKVLISIAAGLETETIQGFLQGVTVPVLRVMPNTCAAIGKGMLALCGGTGITEEDFTAVEEILSQAGLLSRIPEAQMDAYAAVAGCGPAYVYAFIEALADGGVMAGLPRQEAQRYAAQTLLGAAAMVLETGKHPGLLKDEVCSPGGSTIAGIAALEAHAFRGTAIAAVQAAFHKNKELGKQ